MEIVVYMSISGEIPGKCVRVTEKTHCVIIMP